MNQWDVNGTGYSAYPCDTAWDYPQYIKVDSILLNKCENRFDIEGLEIAESVTAQRCNGEVYLWGLLIDDSTAPYLRSGVSFYDSVGVVDECSISNRNTAIRVNGNMSSVGSWDNTGSGNTYGLAVYQGGQIHKSGTQPSGTTAELVDEGVIFPLTASQISDFDTEVSNNTDVAANSAVRLLMFNQSAEPNTTELPAGRAGIWTDTDDNKCYLCFNHSGTVKKVELA